MLIEDIKLLKSDYERRFETTKSLINENKGKMKENRLRSKVSCYRTFISELNRIITRKEA